MQAEDAKTPVWMCINLYEICPVPLVSELSSELLKIYQACDGTKRCVSPAEYYALGGIYLDACDIIDDERARVERIKNGHQH